MLFSFILPYLTLYYLPNKITMSDTTANICTENTFAIIKVCVNKDYPELRIKYESHIQEHNDRIRQTEFPNSGFDLLVPDRVEIDKPFQTTFIDHQITCEMVLVSNNITSFSPFQLFPRSSLAKTQLMLANHVGIIDSGYRGHIIGAFRWFGGGGGTNADTENEPATNCVVDKHARLLQICHPSLCPVFAVMAEESDIRMDTDRGIGGFGSTGK